MRDVMLNPGSDVKIFPMKYWQLMGNSKLVCSPLQLILPNQYNIYPIRKLTNVEVNIDGVKTMADFESIEIMEDTNPYPYLLGIDWEFENNSIFNLKHRHVSFENEELWVVAPLDVLEGEKYTESIRDDTSNIEIENIYNVIGSSKYYVNHISNREISWCNICIFTQIHKNIWND